MKPLSKPASLLSDRQRFQLKNLGFIVILCAIIGMLGWLSQRHNQWWDWSANQSNSLSQQSIELVTRLDQPLNIELFASSVLIRQNTLALLERYRRQAPQRIHIETIDPAQQPEYTRDQNVSVDGEIILQYGDQRINIKQANESAISDVLTGLLRKHTRKAWFLSDHGERKPDGKANHDYRLFSRQLEAKGIHFAEYSLRKDGPPKPDQQQLLVIADPVVPLLDNEVQLILDYVKQGGNLLWLSNPDTRSNKNPDNERTAKRRDGLARLAQALGIEFLPGVIVDATTRQFGINDPTISLVTQYPHDHPLTRDFEVLSLFPKASALALAASDAPAADWQAKALLESPAQSWTETGAIKGNIGFDSADGEHAGPLVIGFSLVRDRARDRLQHIPLAPDATPNAVPDAAAKAGKATHQQRVIVIGDSDFISNTFLGNSGNLELGLRLFNWLLQDDTLLSIPPRPAPDTTLNLPQSAQFIIGAGFLFVLPISLLISGIVVWRKRRNL